jgi:hypothetical protein
MTFPITRSRFTPRILIAVTAGCLVVAAVLMVALFRDTFERDLVPVVLISLLPALVIFMMHRQSRGDVSLTEEKIEVNTKWENHSYPWSDVSSVEVSTLSQQPLRLLNHLVGEDVERPHVRIRVSRRRRYNLWPARISTRGFGIPTAGHTAVVYPDDPDGLADAAQRFLMTSAKAY